MKVITHICPFCGLSGRWIDLIMRNDIVEESGWRIFKMFHLCPNMPKLSLLDKIKRFFGGKDPRPMSEKISSDEFAWVTKDGIKTEIVTMVEMDSVAKEEE